MKRQTNPNLNIIIIITYSSVIHRDLWDELSD